MKVWQLQSSYSSDGKDVFLSVTPKPPPLRQLPTVRVAFFQLHR
ncbi:hypothetical protein [Iningainema tapete]|nr:hypothetical protein [Iningainema tapete]